MEATILGISVDDAKVIRDVLSMRIHSLRTAAHHFHLQGEHNRSLELYAKASDLEGVIYRLRLTPDWSNPKAANPDSD